MNSQLVLFLNYVFHTYYCFVYISCVYVCVCAHHAFSHNNNNNFCAILSVTVAKIEWNCQQRQHTDCWGDEVHLKSLFWQCKLRGNNTHPNENIQRAYTDTHTHSIKKTWLRIIARWMCALHGQSGNILPSATYTHIHTNKTHAHTHNTHSGSLLQFYVRNQNETTPSVRMNKWKFNRHHTYTIQWRISSCTR